MGYDAHPNPVRKIDLDQPPTRSANPNPALRGHTAPAAIGTLGLSPRIGDDTELNKFHRLFEITGQEVIFQ
jgi:hypothetical protein